MKEETKKVDESKVELVYPGVPREVSRDAGRRGACDDECVGGTASSSNMSKTM